MAIIGPRFIFKIRMPSLLEFASNLEANNLQ